MDKIIISNLIARGIIGVNQWERTTIQEISITMTLFINLEKAGISDSMEDTISYSDIAKKALTIAETKKRKTVEALANDLAQMCLEDIRVQRVVVKVEKPGAVRFAKSVGVEIERAQSQQQGH